MELIKNCRIHSVVYLYLHWFEFYMFSKMISNEKWHMCYENQLCGLKLNAVQFAEEKHRGICFYRNQAWNNSDCNIKTFFLYFRTLIDKLSKSFMMAAYFGPNLSKLCVVSSTYPVTWLKKWWWDMNFT